MAAPSYIDDQQLGYLERLNVPLDFYCTQCNELQHIPHILGKGTKVACKANCNGTWQRFYQTKVYFVCLSQIQIKPADKFKLQLQPPKDSRSWYYIHTLQIKNESQGPSGPSHAYDVQMKKVANGNDEKEDVFQVDDTWIAAFGAIPRLPIQFELQQHSVSKQEGTKLSQTYRAEFKNMQGKYYERDGQESGEFKASFRSEDKTVGEVSGQILVVGVTPLVFHHLGFLHVDKHEDQKETANWCLREYGAEEDEFAEERTNVTAAKGKEYGAVGQAHVADASTADVAEELGIGKVESEKLLNWIYSNKEVLRELAQKLKNEEHEWSANDFSNVNELGIKQSEITRWFDEYRTYFIDNKHSFLLLNTNADDNNEDEVHLFQVEQQVEEEHLLQMAGSRCLFELHNVNDAICLLVRYQYLKNTLFSGFDDEFNIYRSYCFDRRTEYKSLKLVLSAFTLMLQITMTTAMYYEVFSAWKEQKWDLQSTSGSFIFVAAIVLFFYSSYLTNITVQKTYYWYLYFSRICYVSMVVVMFDFISNILIPIAIAAISFFWLSAAESMADIVLNSFALLFVFYLDDVVNTFEKDEEVLLKEDMTLFVAAMNKSEEKTVARIVENSKCGKLGASFLWEVLLAFPMNLYHLFLFVCFLPRYHRRYASRRVHT